jgi:hypothetical protein
MYSSNEVFEFSHSPNSPEVAPIPTANYPTGTFVKSKNNTLIDDCLENLLDGVDIPTTDETNHMNNPNHPFNESQRIFNNTLKGLSETLRNLRYEDQ